MTLTETPPKSLGHAFEAEAAAMGRALKTGELPPKDAPYYERVKRLAEMYWAAKNQYGEGRS